MLIKEGKTNWKYLLMVAILAGMVGGGILWLSRNQEIRPLGLLEIKNTEVGDKEENEKEKEVIDGVVIIRNLDKELIRQKIEQGKQFLFRMEHEEEHGFYKKYDVINDSLEDRLHTVYSASIIYTLLKIYDFDNDEKILEGIPDWADFLLAMQSEDEKTYGAFHYSYYFEDKEKELMFVVGTTALSIFTLLDLHERTGDAKYLQSAKSGGDWLISMQGADGVMKPYRRYKDGKWSTGEKESLLYNGQVLSALSRLYKVSDDKRYYEVAEKIAKHFIERVAEDGCYLSDDYRNKNPISSAWVVMSLLDFYKVDPKETYLGIIFGCSEGLLKRQLDDATNPLHYGRWNMAYSTSGNGWLAEVMMELYHFCLEQGRAECDQYKEAVVKVIRWLVQNTYSQDNTSSLPNPEKAIGGLFWNYQEKYVRTDSVCHGLNAYLGIINDLGDGLLLF